MLLAHSSSSQVAIVLGGIVLVWIVPSIFVSGAGAGEGFRAGPVFVAALFVGWPLVLLVILLFGQKSPLVRALSAAAAERD